MQRAEAEDYCRERTNKNCDPRISYKVGKSHTGEFYVAKSVHGREDSRIYSTSVEPCDHEWVSGGEGSWPICKHCETRAPDDYGDPSYEEDNSL